MKVFFSIQGSDPASGRRESAHEQGYAEEITPGREGGWMEHHARNAAGAAS